MVESFKAEESMKETRKLQDIKWSIFNQWKVQGRNKNKKASQTVKQNFIC